ncbi:MAG: hypothetical protein HY713_03860 [candidate division NC10 bacterium]|nr:hypothetical protein [candidate division NC10 bacterium]
MGVGSQQAVAARKRAVVWVVLIAALTLLVTGPAVAQEPCQGGRLRDPRTSRLQMLDLRVGKHVIAGRVKNTSGETALGVGVWVNYYLSRRGGLSAQQCIPLGDLGSGEERAFQAIPIPEADRTESYDYAVDAVGWR